MGGLFALGPFDASMLARDLRKNGVSLKLQDQPVLGLQALIEKPRYRNSAALQESISVTIDLTVAKA